MKKNKILIIVLIIPFLSFAQNLDLVLSIEKNEFLIREPITIIAELVNKDNKPITIKDITDFTTNEGGGLRVELIDLSTGILLKKNVSVSCVSNKKTIKLLSGESAIQAIPIVPVFYGTTSEGEIRPFYSYLLPGKYQITLVYNYELNKTHFGVINNLQKYYSKPIEFQIKEVKNKEDADLLKSYDEVMASFNIGYPRRRITEYQLYRSSLEKLLKKYPNSNYRRLVYRELIKNTRSLPNYSFIKKYYTSYFSEYPNNYGILFYLQNEEHVNEVIDENDIKIKLQKTDIKNFIVKQKLYTEKINKWKREIGRLKNEK